MWDSHKFQRPGFLNKFVIFIDNVEILWLHGPIACRRWPDIKTFKHRMLQVLGYVEKMTADSGYQRGKWTT